ncbi:hypothetical protein Pth03_47450 [Planotetraspora thailandica]|uniref:Secreted protein n=1 Tax=Planotetraspora thailandica TaxID=487172 RepID=A0A8J3V7I7_9ACTN|nr:hypothetical protein Pth03_47450 [Planotetraspora thailandica]
MRAAAVAVTCAAVGLSGAIAANASNGGDQAQAKMTDARKPVVYPRLGTTNIVTSWGGARGGCMYNPPTCVPRRTDVLTGTARQGVPWVHSPTPVNGGQSAGWVNLSAVFPGFVYDISVAPAPSGSPLAGPAHPPIQGTGIPGGLVRVTVRKADGSIFYADCATSVIATLAPRTCTAETLRS